MIYWKSHESGTLHAWLPDVRTIWKVVYARKRLGRDTDRDSYEYLQQEFDNEFLATLRYAYRIRLVENWVGSSQQAVEDGEYGICLTEPMRKVFEILITRIRGRPVYKAPCTPLGRVACSLQAPVYMNDVRVFVV